MADPRRDRPPSLGELRSHRDAILEIARRHGVLTFEYSDPWLAVMRTATVTSTSWSNWSPAAASSTSAVS